MPIVVVGRSVPPPKPKLIGRLSYNKKIKNLVPAIQEARANKHWGVRDMADYLNSKGVLAPSGRPFSYTTLRDILKRLEKLGVIDGPRSKSEAASGRRSPGRHTISGTQRGRYVRCPQNPPAEPEPAE